MLGQIEVRRASRPRGNYDMPGIGNASDVATSLLGEPAKLVGWAIIAWTLYKWLGEKKRKIGETWTKRKKAKKRRKADELAAKMRQLGFDVKYEEHMPSMWER